MPKSCDGNTIPQHHAVVQYCTAVRSSTPGGDIFQILCILVRVLCVMLGFALVAVIEINCCLGSCVGYVYVLLGITVFVLLEFYLFF